MAPRIKFTREQLADAVAANASYAATARALGYQGRSSGQGMVKRWIEHFGLSTDHFGGVGSHSGRSSNYQHTREQLAEAVRDSRTFSDVCRALGRSTTGGTSTHIARIVRREGIDTSHFMTRAEFSARSRTQRKGADRILVLLPPDANRTSAATLRRCLTEIGVPEVCACCGMGPLWNGKLLTLQVDHENGNRLDNRRENLRFLCPNCHARQPTTLSKKPRQAVA
jgi:5-methylcytosine-specific restriction endonuclease McrA